MAKTTTETAIGALDEKIAQSRALKRKWGSRLLLMLLIQIACLILEIKMKWHILGVVRVAGGGFMGSCIGHFFWNKHQITAYQLTRQRYFKPFNQWYQEGDFR